MNRTAFAAAAVSVALLANHAALARGALGVAVQHGPDRIVIPTAVAPRGQSGSSTVPQGHGSPPPSPKMISVESNEPLPKEYPIKAATTVYPISSQLNQYEIK
jgi:hypothetical protein